jgi:hypothetical protein
MWMVQKSHGWEGILKHDFHCCTVHVTSIISFNIPTYAHNLYTLKSNKERQTHTKMEWNDVRPQTAQFYNKRISTDPILVTWQSTVYEPPEEGFKKIPKHVGASVKSL